ncbi:hypothetical protein F7725_018025 [Dissostichus mawsoni]|uniref:Ig-like domain-containing protein n=1 Tax=Dissostichus mawsoni TaxID=36200 RepID=A0A7J5XT84_DISMA|nr:hypothetical protein F7725_018025 [Dissostichus mawsoni]
MTSFSVGSNLTLLCSAQSGPEARLQWAFGGETLNTTGPLLELLSVLGIFRSFDSSIILNKTTGSQQIYASRNPLAVGSSVTLFSQNNVTAGAWIFDNNFIVFIAPGSVNIANSWKDRVTFNPTTSSLTITSVKLEDSGEYTLQALSPNNFIYQLTLSVQVPISNVSLTASATDLVEFNDTAVAAGAGVQLSDGGATLTMVGVTRYDEGSYRCNVSNAPIAAVVVNPTGGPPILHEQYMLHCEVTGYVENIQWSRNAPVTMASIKIVGAQPIMNHTFTLTCETAGSVHYIGWMYNLSQLHADNTKNISMDNATLTFNPVTNADNGDYRCEANNALSHFVGPIFSLEVFCEYSLCSLATCSPLLTGENFLDLSQTYFQYI